jgi:uncharacterized protein (TIGR02646 family)
MRSIEKGSEPQILSKWKKKNKAGTYADLSHEERQAIRQACLEEQHYLCAYCCQSIGKKAADCTNEHVQPRDKAPKRQLDFTNIVASCSQTHQCNQARGNELLPLTPLMPECETELKFFINGRVEGLSDRANKAIQTLNLGDHERNNRKLVTRRKAAIQTLLFASGMSSELRFEDSDLLNLMLEQYQQPKQGRLDSFAPVLVNILRQWL